MARPLKTTQPELVRTDGLVDSDRGVRIFVRAVRSPKSVGRVPIVLVHGGGPGGLASFDLPVRGYSLPADLAADGHPVYVMDVRGWGRSTRPRELDLPPEENPPAVRSDEAARDVGAVVDNVRDQHDGTRVALIGWATGGHWCALHATRQPDGVSHLVMLNSLYGVKAPWQMREGFEASERPGEFDASIGAYTLRSAESLLRGWDSSIPIENKAQWRDPRVAEAYVVEALASDPLSATHSPPAMRIPAGFQLDSYGMSRGWRPWEARDVRARTLVIRGERDFWSRPDDVATLQRELTNAEDVRLVTIPDGTHYLFNDRPEHGRQQFLEEVVAFLAKA
jgi:pimeloyl-ACP methyl ester carboxylesterase